jgi:hypothetical protein
LPRLRNPEEKHLVPIADAEFAAFMKALGK